jgi:hypothetical protein
MQCLPATFRDLAEFQCGVITSRQALLTGLTTDTIRAQLDGGRWQRIHRGVLAAFSGEPGRMALLWAAVLRAGPGAALSHYTAAELHGMARKPSQAIHVTVPVSRRPEPITGVVVHRSRRIRQARHPAQSPPRTRVEETVLDLADVARTFDDALGWLCAACGGRLTTPQLVHDAMAGRARLRYREGLQLALADVASGVHAVLEYRYLRDVERGHGLPRARRQFRVIRGTRSEYLDALYREYLVAVETDGRLAHPAEARWADVRRDNAAAADGIITLRYGWSDVTRRPCRVAAEVGAVLSRRGWPGPLRSCGPACGLRCPA